jgi:hypothetical protein
MAGAPPLPRNVFLGYLAEFCIPTSVCKFVPPDMFFHKIEFSCQPIADAGDIAESRPNILLSINAFMNTFKYSRSRATSALKHEMDRRGDRWKHTALNSDRERQILDWNKQNVENSTLITKKLKD